MQTSAFVEDPPRAGWHVDPWCRSAGVSRVTVYTLPPDQRPESIKIGRRRLIIESPDAWLRRVGVRDEVAA